MRPLRIYGSSGIVWNSRIAGNVSSGSHRCRASTLPFSSHRRADAIRLASTEAARSRCSPSPCPQGRRRWQVVRSAGFVDLRPHIWVSFRSQGHIIETMPLYLALAVAILLVAVACMMFLTWRRQRREPNTVQPRDTSALLPNANT